MDENINFPVFPSMSLLLIATHCFRQKVYAVFSRNPNKVQWISSIFQLSIIGPHKSKRQFILFKITCHLQVSPSYYYWVFFQPYMLCQYMQSGLIVPQIVESMFCV